MTLEEECRLSYYREIAVLNEAHGVCLVQHTVSRQLFVKKQLTVYRAQVFRRLMECPVPNIPRIFEIVESDGVLIVIEEYISGRTLSDLLAEKGCLPERQAIDIARQLCAILMRLHGMDPPVIHRDIKPSNLILSPDGVVKLLDLNAAKWSDPRAERDTQLIGTVGFAAPEQYGFGASNAQTDLYSVGVLLNRMAAGALPQQRQATGEIGRIVAKCTQMDPKKRYGSAERLMNALEKCGAAGKAAPSARYCRFLPPGFRSLSPLRMIFSGIGYLLLFLLGLTLKVPDATPVGLLLNRIAFLSIALSWILITANYMDVWDRIGITKIRSEVLRSLAVIGWDVLILVVGFVLLSAAGA